MSGIGVQHLGVESVEIGLAITCICLILSMALKLHLTTNYLVAMIRMILQLTLLGYILVPVFNHPSWELSLLISSIMTMIAAWEAYQQARFHYSGQFVHTWLAIALSMFATLIMVIWLCIPIRPFYTPQVRFCIVCRSMAINEEFPLGQHLQYQRICTVEVTLRSYLASL